MQMSLCINTRWKQYHYDLRYLISCNILTAPCSYNIIIILYDYDIHSRAVGLFTVLCQETNVQISQSSHNHQQTNLGLNHLPHDKQNAFHNNIHIIISDVTGGEEQSNERK